MAPMPMTPNVPPMATILPTPAPLSNDPYAMNPQDRVKYEEHFKQLAGSTPFVNGPAARQFFINSGLDQMTLKQIWQISDLDNDGNLDISEFCVAMHLIRLKVKTPALPIPATLPPSLASAKQTPRGMPPTMGTGLPPMGTGMPPSMGTGLPSSYPMGANPAAKSAEMQNLLNQSKAISQDMISLQQQLGQSQANAEEYAKSEAQIKAEIERARMDMQKMRQDKNLFDSQAAAAQARVEVLKGDKDMLSNDMHLIREEIEKLEMLRQKADETRVALEKDIVQLQLGSQHTMQELIGAKESAAELKAQFAQITSQRAEQEKQLNATKDELFSVKETLRLTNSAIADLQSQINAQEATKREYTKAAQTTTTELAEVTNKKGNLEQQLKSIKAELTSREKQFANTTSAAEKAKTLKLQVLVKKIEELVNDFNNALKVDAASFGNITVAPSMPEISKPTNIPAPVKQPTPVVAPAPTTTAHDDFGFDNSFDSFASPVVKPQTPPQQQQPPVQVAPKPQPPAADNFGFDDFEPTFDEPAKPLPPVPAATKALPPVPKATPITNGFDDFSSDNSSVTKPPPKGDFDFEDFGFTTTQPAAQAPKPAPPATQSLGFDDDFGF